MAVARGAAPRRAADLGRIHIVAKQLGLIDGVDDTAYRDMLWAIARVRSAKDLDKAGREAVLRHLGANSKRPRYEKGSQAALIRHLWTSLAKAGSVEDSSDKALRAYCKKQSLPYHPQRAGYDAPELLPAWVAGKVIEHLKAWCDREKIDH